MENRFKSKLSRMFRGSFTSCRTTASLSDVVEKPLFTPPPPPQKATYSRLSGDPKSLPFTSICKPKCPETTTKAISDSILPRKKISGRYPHGHFCPPVSPSSPLNPFYQNPKNSKKKKNNNKNSKQTNSSYQRRNLFSSSSQDSAYFDGKYCFSTDEEDEKGEKDTLFSSRSTFSSDSSNSRRHQRQKRRARRRRRREEMGVMEKVKGSFAVVKKSSDPYNDFRVSMVEMIVENQIFGAYDLEQLLQCFLSLNSEKHHRIIVEVFTEIYEVLFSNWGD